MSKERPRIIAHRGDHGAGRPENSISAFQAALKGPADGVEFDVQLSRDGKVVVFHDSSLERLTGATGHLRKHEWKHLHALRLRDRDQETDERIPLLANVLELPWEGRLIYMELKSRVGPKQDAENKELLERTLDVIDDFCESGNVYLASFNSWLLRDAQRMGCGLPTILNVDNPGRLPARTGDGEFRFEIISPAVKILDHPLVCQIHESGSECFCWTANDPDLVKYVVNLNVDGIVTDSVNTLMEVLGDSES